VQQARSYAEMLRLNFAYATNGHDIIEIDYFTGKETRVYEGRSSLSPPTSPSATGRASSAIPR